MTIVKQESGDQYKVIQTLVTQPGLKTMVHRGTTHNVYLSGAEYEPDGKTIKPGTFGVYIYSMK